MKAPRYRFYLGRVSSARVSDNYKITETGAAVPSATGDYLFSRVADLSGYLRYVFINASFSGQYSAVYFIGSSSSVVGKVSLDGMENPVIPIPEGTLLLHIGTTRAESPDLEARRGKEWLFFMKEALPHNKGLKIKTGYESGEKFMRQSIDGSVKLFASDYTFVRESSLDTALSFVVQRYNSENTAKTMCASLFTKIDCKFDHDRKKCEIASTEPMDDYADILPYYEEEYDLIKLGVPYTPMRIDKKVAVQVYITGSRSVSVFANGEYWEQDMGTVYDDGGKLLSYHFGWLNTYTEIKITGCRLADMNGVYTGSNGKFKNKNGLYLIYVSKYGQLPGWDSDMAKLCIVDSRNESEIVPGETKYSAYRSSKVIKFYSTEYHLLHGGDYDMEYNKTQLDGEPVYKFKAEVITYPVYARYVTASKTLDVGSKKGVQTYEITGDDVVGDDFNMDRCYPCEDTFMIEVSQETTKEQMPFGVNDEGDFFTPPRASRYERYMPVCKQSWGNMAVWCKLTQFYWDTNESGRVEATIRHAYRVSDVIQYLLRAMGSSLKHEPLPEYSSFLYGIKSQEGFAYAYRQLMIAPKSNVLRASYDEPAKKAPLTFESLMKMLEACFRLYWFIEGDKFRLEQLPFFLNGKTLDTDKEREVTLDLTMSLDRMNGMPYSFFQSEVEYDKAELAETYEFSWPDGATNGFIGTPLEFKSVSIPKGSKKEVSVSGFMPDIDSMVANPGAHSKDGFAVALTEDIVMNLSPMLAEAENWRYIDYRTGEDRGIGMPVPTAMARANTNYVTCGGATSLTITLLMDAPTRDAGIAFYDADTNYISGEPCPVGNTAAQLMREVTIPVPPGAKSFRGTYAMSDEPVKASYHAVTIPTEEMLVEDADQGLLYKSVLQNSEMTWTALHSNYMYDAPSANLVSKAGSDLRVQKVLRFAKQKVEAFHNDGFDSLGLVKTSVGLGSIASYEINTDTDKISVDIELDAK